MKSIISILLLLSANAFAVNDVLKDKILERANPGMVDAFYANGKYVVTIPLKELKGHNERAKVFALAVKNGKNFLVDYMKSVDDYKEFADKLLKNEKASQTERINYLKQISQLDHLPSFREIQETYSDDVSYEEILDLYNKSNELDLGLEKIISSINEIPKTVKELPLVDDYVQRLNILDSSSHAAYLIMSPQIRVSDSTFKGIESWVSRLGVLGKPLRFLANIVFKKNSVNLAWVGRPIQVFIYDMATKEQESAIVWDYDILTFVQKDAEPKKVAGKIDNSRNARFRLGFGIITGEMDETNDLSGAFAGVSMNFVNQRNPMGVGNEASYPVNVKVGTFTPYESVLYYANPRNFARNNYIIVSAQSGVKGPGKQNDWNKFVPTANGNVGVVLSSSRAEKFWSGSIEDLNDLLSPEKVDELLEKGSTTTNDGSKITIETTHLK
tara:strand:- start:3367 stop:4692 length:1326 start_codon:yes stop_codon:yes gene_type:complete